MMSAIFGGLIIVGMGALLLKGQGDQAAQAMLSGASDAVNTCLLLAGSFAVFCGLMEILRRAGTVDTLSKWLKRPLRALLGREDVNEAALSDVTLNLASNMLGLGNAATPAGVRAAEKLARGERATNALCVFLVLNASSVQLFPATVVAMRAAAGSASPAAVVLPTLAATLCASVVGVALCKAVEKFT